MWFVRSAYALVALAFLFVALAPASAQEAADCLACHGDRESLSSFPEGERLYVDGEAFAKSLHAKAGLSCVLCHTELIGAVSCPECSERMVPLFVRGGGTVQICPRRGCKGHMLDVL